MITKYGKLYYNDKFDLYRSDGPALVYFDGTKIWCNFDADTCTIPKKYFPNGIYKWDHYGVSSRDDGPLYDCPNGIKEWWIKGKRSWPKL